MAKTVAPVITTTGSPNGVSYVLWEDVATGDTITPLVLRKGYKAALQISGTFGSATGTLVVSNDGTTFAPALNVAGSAVSATAAAVISTDLRANYVKPGISGGTNDSVDFLLVLRD